MMAIQKSVYLDTTIPSYYVDERESLSFQAQLTRRWWKENTGQYILFASNLTLQELENGSFPNRERAISLIDSVELLRPTQEVVDIAQIYINNKLMPHVLEGDAMHLAYASFYGLDFLLTWNCNHLANANKRQHIAILNTKLGIGIPAIVTPMELFREEGM